MNNEQHREQNEPAIDTFSLDTLESKDINKINIGLIIGKLRIKLFDIIVEGITTENKTENKDDIIEKIINILQLPVISIKNTNITTINALYNYISNLTIEDIEDFFLSNQIQKEDFLKLSKEFLNSNSGVKFSDKIIK